MEQKQTAVEWLYAKLETLRGELNYDVIDYEMYKIEKTRIYREALHREKQQRQIELPSDEDIKEYVKSTGYYGHCTHEYHEGIEEGAKWMRDKIGGNK